MKFSTAKSYLRHLAVCAIGLLSVAPAHSTEFKLQNNQVFGTLKAAEAAMRAESSAMALLQLMRIERLSPTKVQRVYGIAPAEPTGPFYFFASDTDPFATLYDDPEEACLTELPENYTGYTAVFGSYYHAYDWPHNAWTCYSVELGPWVNLGPVYERWMCPPEYILYPTAYPPLCLNTSERVIEVTSYCEVNCGCPHEAVRVGNPINLAIANKCAFETDYVAGADGLSFRRYYNSALPAIQKSISIGLGWKHNYDRRIDTTQHWTPSVWAQRPDGREFQFSSSGGLYEPISLFASEKLARLTDSGGNHTGWRFTSKEDEVELYDTEGKLLSITSAAGISQILIYDSIDRLEAVTDSFGRALQFAYNSANLISTVTLPVGGVLEFSYGSNANLASVEYPTGHTKLYLYNESSYTQSTDLPNALTGILDESSSRFATYKYDSSGRAISTEHAGSVEKYEISYSSPYSQSVVTDPLGKIRTYSLTPGAGLVVPTAVSLPCLHCGSTAAMYSYDGNYNVSSRTDFNGNTTTYSHDTSRNLEASRTEAYGTSEERTITTTWHSTFRLPIEIVESNRTTTLNYDSDGNLLERTITDTESSPNVSRTLTYSYNSFGKVLTEDGPRTDVSDVTTYTYYSCNTGAECGQVETVTNALGHVTTYDSYNAHGAAYTDHRSEWIGDDAHL